MWMFSWIKCRTYGHFFENFDLNKSGRWGDCCHNRGKECQNFDNFCVDTHPLIFVQSPDFVHIGTMWNTAGKFCCSCLLLDSQLMQSTYAEYYVKSNTVFLQLTQYRPWSIFQRTSGVERNRPSVACLSARVSKLWSPRFEGYDSA